MRALISGVVLFAAALSATAFDFIGKRGFIRWPAGEIPMYVLLNETREPRPFGDGSKSWNAVALESLSIWNAVLPQVQFTGITDADIEPDHGNDVNEVFFSPNIYGHRFGDRVLAVTTTWYVGSRRTEGDTILNEAIPWDSYRGPRTMEDVDLRRVLIHEFGHTLGLDHPDQANEVVVAMMNSVISDLDTLADDDIRGARALYAPPGSRYPVTITIDPPNAGTATVIPESLDGTYPAGTVVKIVPRATQGFRFNYWENSEPLEKRSLKLRIWEPENLTANFSSNSAPRIVTAPTGQLLRKGQTLTLQVTATGTAPLLYQWRLNGTDIPGETDATLTVFEVSHNESGLYSVVVRNSTSQVESRPARVIVSGY